MPTNADTFNSRITSEALEKKFRDTFPAQGGAELVQDLYAQGVIVPTIDFSDAALGSGLAQDLQQAWDFGTGAAQIVNTTTNLITNPGFWRIQGVSTQTDLDGGAVALNAAIQITDGITTKQIWGVSQGIGSLNNGGLTDTFDFIVFLRSGDTLQGYSRSTITVLDIAYRQIATVSGDLINPLGFTSS